MEFQKYIAKIGIASTVITIIWLDSICLHGM